MGSVNSGFLSNMGVYGFEDIEPVIIASLISGDPLLLIGKAGTGKTHLLNAIAENLRIVHRHYNASLISFDDLVGFPWPQDGKIEYLPTPATIWEAESVLVDEINRCRVEHQNRFFSLIHEKKIQGVGLGKLKYRWAAMNPPGLGEDGESYEGCQPLDPALADRFSFLIDVPDWKDISGEAQWNIVAGGGGGGTVDPRSLADLIRTGRSEFCKKIASPDRRLIAYVCKVTELFNQSGIRISPRRAKQIGRNIMALQTVGEGREEEVFLKALTWSLPQRATLGGVGIEIVQASHRIAWDSECLSGSAKWIHLFHSKSTGGKLELTLFEDIPKDTLTLAVCQFLVGGDYLEKAIFSFALFPVLLDPDISLLGEEAVNDLGLIAKEIYELKATLTWIDRSKAPYRPTNGGRYSSKHPQIVNFGKIFTKLPLARRKRAEIFFSYLVAKNKTPGDIETVEKLLEECYQIVQKFHATLHP